MTWYSRFPAILGGLATAAAARGGLGLRAITNGLSPALLLPDSYAGPLRPALATLNPFGLWTLGLLVLGFSVAARISVRRSAVWIVGTWLVAAAAAVAATGLSLPG